MLVILGGTIGGLIVGATFIKDTLTAMGPRRQRPWDV